jgi:predicted kinase
MPGPTGDELARLRHDGGMASRPPARSVKISEDERGGWSSDRPRRDGAPPRPADVTVHCRVLTPADRLRYSPGSLLVVVCASRAERDRFLDRLIEDRASLLSLDKVRGLLAGRVQDQELDERAAELLLAAVSKRLENKETVVLGADGLAADERERFVRIAAALKRPRHLILLETAREHVAEEDLGALNELRRALDAGELGTEGFQTALRLGGGTASEVKRILFRPPPREEA